MPQQGKNEEQASQFYNLSPRISLNGQSGSQKCLQYGLQIESKTDITWKGDFPFKVSLLKICLETSHKEKTVKTSYLLLLRNILIMKS